MACVFCSLSTLNQRLLCNAASHSGPAGWCKHLCSGPVDVQRLPRLQSFASFWKFPYILSFAYIPSTQSLKAAKPPLRFPGVGILLFAKGAPFAQFTKMSAKDGWAMLLWTHSVFRACGVSYASFLLSAAGCLIEYVHVYTLHKLPGVQPMVTVQCSSAFWPGSVV